MKKCNYCKEEKELTEYHKNHRTPDGYDRRCKECQKAYKRERTKKGDGHWSVYYLTKEGYYGHTRHLKTRIKAHKYSGKDISGYKVVKTKLTKSEALFYEKLNQKKLKSKKVKQLIKVYYFNELICLAKTLKLAGDKAGVSRERVRQLLDKNVPTKKGYYFYK